MPSESTLILLFALVLFVNFIYADDVSVRSRRNTLRGRPRSRMPGWLSGIDRSSAAEVSGLRDISAFIPDVPNESEVNCQIEFEVVRAVGGRCVRLGGVGRTAVCQSGIYLDLQNQECEGILAARENHNEQNHDPQHSPTDHDGDEN
ncbi:hypothetical protein ACF0H5_001658 [Mactra antiquata]